MPAFSLRIREYGGGLRLETPESRCQRLDPGATIALDATILFHDRGHHRLEGVDISTAFPFGLFEKTVRLPADADALVYPAVSSLTRSSGRSSADEGPAGVVRGTTGMSRVREYRAGDDPRLIHWKQSARRSKLVVREPEPEGTRVLVLVFSNRLPPDPLPVHRVWFEDAVRLTASLADRALREGRDVLLATWDGVTRPGRGAGQLERVLRTLATIAPSSPRAGDRLIAWTENLSHPAADVILVWDDPAWTRVRAACDRVWVASRHTDGIRV
jgi:uncharacterized protein (DUF58 family)